MGSDEADAPSESSTAPLAHDTQVLTNKTLGEFRILRRIGRGGMAEVYLAEQTSLNRNVAIKVLRPELVADESHLKRFRTEALASAGLNHRNIVQVYSVGSEGGVEYIAQEYVQGYNLRQFLVRKGPPDLPVAMRIMKQIAAALEAAGQAGIVHRDIKPENILINRKGEVKITDFGLAQLTLQGERVNLTQVGTTMGTPLYMSPEQVNGSKVGHPSDIYSFGVTAYHLLAGSPPFRGQTAMSIAAQHLKNDPPPLEDSRPDLPILLCRIVNKMMAKDLNDRYRTAGAVLQDLRRVESQQSEDGTAATGGAAMPTVESQEQPSDTGGLSQSVETILQYPDRPLLQQAMPFFIATAICFAIGFGVGWLALPANPLKATGVRPKSRFIKEDTALRQFIVAERSGGSEDAWLAVIENHPNDEVFRDKAYQELAIIYLIEDRIEEAERIFDRFVRAPESELAQRVFGHAGRVVVLNVRREFAESQKEFFREVWPLREHLSGTMRRMVRSAVRENRDKIPEKQAEGVEDFLRDESQPAVESSETSPSADSVGP